VAWIFLDWAASGFSTISITLLVAYFNKIVFATGGWGIPGGVLWAWTLAATMLLSALVSPFLSAWVDRRHIHQRAVVISSMLGAAACITLALLPATSQVWIIAAIIVATVSFDMASI
jgi:Permeases of the major facilitator superfamily